MENNLVLFSFARTPEKCELLLIYARASGGSRRIKEGRLACEGAARVDGGGGGGMDRRDYKLAR